MFDITNSVSEDQTHVTDDERPDTATRRKFLKYAGTAAGITGAAGVAGWELFGSDGADRTTPPGAEDPPATDAQPDGMPGDDPESDPRAAYGERFDTIVDVAERGGDTTGSEPVNDILESNVGDDTLFYFPEGEYQVTDLFVAQHLNNVGFVGPEATLQPSAGQIGDWIIASDVSRLLIEGLTLSSDFDQTGVRAKVHVSGGENVVRNVDVTGFHDVSARTHGFTLQVNGADSVLRLENVDLSDGAENGTGIFVHPSSDPGTLRLENCKIENWYEQGLYGSSHGGPMYVVGGRYANNGKAQVRVGGGAADTEAVVRDVTVRMSDPEPAGTKGNIWGIWLHEGEGTVIENCDVAMTNLSDAGSSGGVVLGVEQGTTTIRDTDIRVDDSTFAIAATSPKDEGFVLPSMESPPDNWEMTVENVSITGTADRDVGIWVVDRPGCTMRNVTIDQEGDDRDGIGLLRSPGAEISGLSCSTSGFSLLTDVPTGHGECLVSLEGLETIESRNHQIDRSDGSSTSDEDGIEEMSAENTGSTDAQAQEGEFSTVKPTNGRYCLDPADFDVSEDRPVLGVTELDAEELYVRKVSESTLDPY